MFGESTIGNWIENWFKNARSPFHLLLQSIAHAIVPEARQKNAHAPTHSSKKFNVLLITPTFVISAHLSLVLNARIQDFFIQTPPPPLRRLEKLNKLKFRLQKFPKRAIHCMVYFWLTISFLLIVNIYSLTGNLCRGASLCDSILVIKIEKLSVWHNRRISIRYTWFLLWIVSIIHFTNFLAK